MLWGTGPFVVWTARAWGKVLAHYTGGGAVIQVTCIPNIYPYFLQASSPVPLVPSSAGRGISKNTAHVLAYPALRFAPV